MNSRERILAAIRHEPLDRVPTDMWATTEVRQALIRHFHIEAPQAEAVEGVGLLGGDLAQSYSVIQELWDRLGIDGILGITPPYARPATARRWRLLGKRVGHGLPGHPVPVEEVFIRTVHE